jgi:hypothetical protein
MVSHQVIASSQVMLSSQPRAAEKHVQIATEQSEQTTASVPTVTRECGKN